MGIKDIYNKATDYLSKCDSNEDKTGVVLFENSTNSKFSQIWLFSKFGNCTGNGLHYSSEITNNYTEENYAVNDHWALKPIQYTLSGLIGEVVYQPPKSWKSAVQNITNYIAPLTAFSPVLDNYTQSALNVVQAVESSALRYRQIARNAYQNFTKAQGNLKTNQEQVATQLKLLMTSRQLVNIATPYETLSNMAIIDVNIRQDANTRFQSNLEITLQQWRDVASDTREATKKELAEWVNLQKQVESNNGNASTQQVDLNKSIAADRYDRGVPIIGGR